MRLSRERCAALEERSGGSPSTVGAPSITADMCSVDAEGVQHPGQGFTRDTDGTCKRVVHLNDDEERGRNDERKRSDHGGVCPGIFDSEEVGEADRRHSAADE